MTVFKENSVITYCSKDLPAIRFADVFFNKPVWAHDIRLAADGSTGLPTMPDLRNVEGTRSEIEGIEKRYHCQWSEGDAMAGLTNRHRGAVLSYIHQLNMYALSIGVTRSDLEASLPKES